MGKFENLVEGSHSQIKVEEKRRIMQALYPKAVLKGLGNAALQAVSGGQLVEDMVVIHSLPFRVGRESRVTMINGRVHRIERPHEGKSNSSGLNELYLFDPGELLQISREHFLIERTNIGGYQVVDRGSKCGTTVGGRRIGVQAGSMSTPLYDGDVIDIGTAQTAYRYQFITGLDNLR